MAEKKKVRRIRLSTPKEIRQYIATLIRRVEADELDLNKARLLMNLAESLLKAHRTDELERRIMEIEEALENGATIQEESTEEVEQDFLRRIM